ncbi:MAG: hypothetical protein DMD43_00890 [Gemmatimonadetes bacterium]|nr:MAG: hypothetical protein DMD43_00890 [Gemmatimonadota bacterium]
MMLGETVRVAFQSIRDHKLRALLTMLGIIIGVGAVIAVVAIGTGAQRAIQARIEALGANLLTIYPGQMFMMGRASDVRVSLLVRDAEALQRDARLLSAVEPELSTCSAPRPTTPRSGITPSRTGGCSPRATTGPGSATPCSPLRSPPCST